MLAVVVGAGAVAIALAVAAAAAAIAGEEEEAEEEVLVVVVLLLVLSLLLLWLLLLLLLLLVLALALALALVPGAWCLVPGAWCLLFGFKIRVQNPEGFDPSQVAGWTLFTADASEYVVDGTPQTIPFTSMDSTSWGIYSSSTLEVMVKISDLRPFQMTERRSWVSVLISNHPVGDTGFIRFRAPEGYVWNFDDTEFVYQTLANTPIGTAPSFYSLAHPRRLGKTPSFDSSSARETPTNFSMVSRVYIPYNTSDQALAFGMGAAE
eukprot:s1147_g1.t1